MTASSPADADALIAAARKALARLCDAGHVRMSIPVRADDEDMVLCAVIDLLEARLAQPAPDAIEQAMAIINAAWLAVPEAFRNPDADDSTGNPLPAAVRALAAAVPAPDAQSAQEALLLAELKKCVSMLIELGACHLENKPARFRQAVLDYAKSGGDAILAASKGTP